jgi:hypothetical protein
MTGLLVRGISRRLRKLGMSDALLIEILDGAAAEALAATGLG